MRALEIFSKQKVVSNFSRFLKTKKSLKSEILPLGILMLLVAAFPLVYSVTTLYPFGLVKLLTILVLGVLSLLSLVLVEKFSLKFKGGYLGPFVFAFVLISLFSTVTGPNPLWSFFGSYPAFNGGLFSLIVLSFLYFLAVNVLTKEKIEWVVSSLVFGVIAATLITVAQNFIGGFSSFLGINSAGGVFGSEENWRILLLLTLPLSGALFLTAKSIWGKRIGLGGLIVFTLTLILPQTASLIQPGTVTLSWADTVAATQKLAQNHLLFGVGPANFANAYETIQNSTAANNSEPIIFSELFNKIITVGGAGFAIYLVLIGAFLKIGWTIYKKLKGEKNYYLYLAVFVAGLAYFIYQIFSPTNFFLEFYLWVILAILSVAVGEEKLLKVKKPAFLNGYLALAAVVAVLGIFYVFGRLYEAEANFTESSKLKNVGNDKEAIAKMAQAANLNPFLDVYKRELGRAKLTLALSSPEATDPAKQQDAAGLIEESIEAAKEAVRLNPSLKVNRLTLTQIYFNAALVNQSYLTQALNSAKETANLFPKDPTSVANLAIIYEETKDYDRAISTYEKLLDLIPEKTMVYARLANAYEGKQDWSKAIENWEKVQADQPDEELGKKIEELKKKLTETPQ